MIGEVHQVFHVIRRKYDLYISRGGEKGEEEMEQFAQIDEGLWAWDFMLKDDESRPLGAISRNFRGLVRSRRPAQPWAHLLTSCRTLQTWPGALHRHW